MTILGNVAPLDRDARSRVNRAEIVSSAARLFALEGYANVRTSEIASATGVRCTRLAQLFASKEEILYEICLTVSREPVEENLPLLDAPGLPSERLAALFTAHVRHLRRRRIEHLVAVHDRALLSPEHHAEIDEYRRYYHRRVRDVLAAGMRAGEFTPLNPTIVALGVLDMLNGVSDWVRGESDGEVEEIVRTYLQMIFTGLRGAESIRVVPQLPAVPEAAGAVARPIG